VADYASSRSAVRTITNSRSSAFTLYFRRKITVYSTLLAAFTIDNGDGPTIGRDLLLSFHDNDHYNSVRLTSSPPLPIPLPEESKDESNDRKRVVVEKRNNVSSGSTQSGDSPSSMETTEKKGALDIAPPRKKNSPCPCGSGLGYKRCCFLSKKKARAKKCDSFSDGESSPLEGEDPSLMKGDFRVLQI